jgi:hypothetical protein
MAPLTDKRESQLTGSLKLCDAHAEKIEAEFNMPHGGNVQETERLLGEFAASAKEFKRLRKELYAELQRQIETLKKAREGKEKKADSGVENMIRGLKVLNTQLEALDRSNDAWQDQQRTRLVSTLQKFDAGVVKMRDWVVVLKAALARGLAAVQRIKASPTAQAYNGEFPKAAQDIVHQLRQVATLAKEGYMCPGPASQKVEELVEPLVLFYTGKLKRLPDDYAPEKVQDVVKVFNQKVKAIEAVYQTVNVRDY